MTRRVHVYVLFAALVLIVGCAADVHAVDIYYYSESSGNWNVVANWTNNFGAAGSEPVSSSKVELGTTDTGNGGSLYNNITVTDAGEACSALWLGRKSVLTTGIVTVASGSLYVDARLEIGYPQGTAVCGLGELHVSGGAFTKGQEATAWIGKTGQGTGLLEITAGSIFLKLHRYSYNAGTEVYGPLRIANGSRFRVDDTANAIDYITVGEASWPPDPTAATNYYQETGATLEVTPGSGGLTTINVSGVALFESGALLEATPGSGTHTIMTAEGGIVDGGIVNSGEHADTWVYAIVDGTGSQQSLQITYDPKGTTIVIK